MSEEHKQFQVQDWAKESWFNDKDNSSLWVSAYRVFRIPKETFTSGPIVIELSKLVAILLYGKMNYLHTQDLTWELTDNEILQLKTIAPSFQETNEGTYLLLIAPFDINGEKGSEQRTSQLITEAVALLTSHYGRNIAYDKVYDNRVHMSSGEVSCFTPSILNPSSMNAPALNKDSVEALTLADSTLYSLESNIQQRIRLSLRWYEASLNDRDIDAFIKSWIAIETIAMPDTSNIRPVNEQLSEIYHIPYKQAKDHFQIGKLAGLRSDIVHDGKIVPMHSKLSDYMDAIYADLLFHALGLPAQYRAKTILEDPAFNLISYLHNV